MSEMIKEASWKQQILLPPINRSTHQELSGDWREN
jgi:hypothetical protein